MWSESWTAFPARNDVLHIVAGAGFRSVTKSTVLPSWPVERASVDPATAQTDGRVGRRRKQLQAATHRGTAESVITGRESARQLVPRRPRAGDAEWKWP